MNTATVEKAMLLALAAIALSFATIAPGLGQNNLAEAADIKYEKAQAAHKILTDKMKNQSIEDIPLYLTYVDQDSTLMVGIYDGAPYSLAVYEARLKQLIGDETPFKIFSGHLEQTACSSRTVNCTSMTGGIRVSADNSAGNERFSTMTYATTDNQGRAGFIMTGHTTGWGVTGSDVGQSSLSRVVGAVVTNPGGTTRACDCVFVDFDTGFSGDQNTIYRGSSTTYSIIGERTSSQTPFNSAVRMSGMVSGYQSGIINGKNLTVGAYDHDGNYIGTLTGSVMTTIVAQAGDSGAPMFSAPNGSNQVYLYGIQFGITQINGFTYTLYSPWEGISSELGVS